MPSNKAAWITAKSANPLVVKEAPYTSPGENEIVVKNHALAINPIDWLLQAMGGLGFEWIKYPFILGCDVAGEVVEVGENVKRFKVGDRVLGNAVATDKRSNKTSEGAFQLYTVLRSNMAAQIPDSMPFTDASVLPLCLSTASCGLFLKDQLALNYPTVATKLNSTGKTLLVWGGSTSVGCNAIQLAVAAGYEVITTASPKNSDFVKSLGASKVFDYRSKTVVQDIIATFKDKESAGAIAIGNDSLTQCIDIIAATRGRKFVAQTSVNMPDQPPKGTLSFIAFVINFLSTSVSLWLKGKIKGVGSKFIFGSDLMMTELGAKIYEDYLPGALAEGKHKALPEPQLAGHGLESVQEAMDTWKRGVSAKKIVVTL